MSWGTNINLDLYLSRITFNSKEDLLDMIHDIQDTINEINQELLMFASSTPKDIVLVLDDEFEDSLRLPIIHSYVSGQLTYLQEQTSLLTKLELFLEHLEDHPEISIEQYNPYKQE